ncbi:hypothetical protein A2973_04310 [Candidatus Gottesmanbacteria bacterium RIFCSPLOWO2_01_FULL_49_10]|uniref:CMP/dCMP-type deaminase domain-containing protein n=1 Tax=Candidatus Gottesmanbacteria bacterium RIFCSPLOWO2_01_FULL_49_10 TaxID=1798396 RepID=A0A1F6AWN1_9BACT|nr:MAG: hypothetical protein A2973_04310 [Candidatus Gottesmanbacteria bacterium RIFCSPLOWO2_01_FULL_49_10]
MTLAQLQNKILLPTPEELDAERAWIAKIIEKIGLDKLSEAIQKAVAMRTYAYPPYSGYKVGAAILCKSGLIYASCNAEVASYSETDHAEGSAITIAISE